MNVWGNPLLYALTEVRDSLSYLYLPGNVIGLPVGPDHPGSYGVLRKHHTHEGVDLYVPNQTPVYAVESGIVVKIDLFTGPEDGSSWWESTQAIMIEGTTGVVVYGEVELMIEKNLKVGTRINRGDYIANVKRVLKEDKGRPTSMLHMELYKHGITEWGAWDHGGPKPNGLRDPTPYLRQVCDTYRFL